MKVISENNPESQDFQKNGNSKQIRLQSEMLRVKASLHLKMIQQIWSTPEQQLPEYFNTYLTMPFSNVTTEQLFNIEKVKMVRNQQKLYLGETMQKKKQGKGIAIYRQGKIFEGEFHLNQKSGHGVQVYQNGNVYVGNFAQNKKHGRGSFFWFNLSEQANYEKIQQYHGDWWGGLPDGYGEHTKANGDLYIGKFKNGLKHGSGTEMYANGDKYKGEFINGLPQGYGEYFWADGAMFKGDFKQGARNGYGLWKSDKQKKQNYKGHYMLDKKHGYGIYDWGNGYVYKGFWMDDFRYGEGTLLYNNEVQYDGYWENGQKVDYKPQSKEIKDTKSRMRQTTQASIMEGTKTLIGSRSKVTDRAFNSQQKNKNRNTSADKRRSVDKQQFSMSFNRQNSHQKGRCGHRSGHKNCVPNMQIGKMPRPPWKV